MINFSLNSKKNILLCLAGIVVFHSIFFSVWIFNNNIPPAWDQAKHMIFIHEFREFFTRGAPNYPDFLAISDYYPPLYYLFNLPFISLLGYNINTTLIVNFLFFILTLILIFKIGQKLINIKTGLLAVVFYSSYYFVHWTVRNTLIDTMLIAMVMLALYLLIMSEDFKNLKYSLLLGIVCGLGMLTKWSFIFFLFFPLLFAKYRAMRDTGKPVLFYFYSLLIFFEIAIFFFFRAGFNLIILVIIGLTVYVFINKIKKHDIVTSQFRNLLIVISIFVIICWAWYGFYFASMFQKFFGNMSIGAREGDPTVLSLSSLTYYLRMINSQTLSIFFIVFILALVNYFIKFKNKNKLLLIYFFGAYFVITLMRNKDLRFSLPLLPIVALISADFLINSKLFGKLKKEILYAVSCLCLVIFLFNSFVDQKIGYWFIKITVPHVYRKLDYRNEEIITKINEKLKEHKNKRPFKLKLLVNHEFLNSAGLKYYTIKNNVPLIVKLVKKEKDNLLELTDFILTKTGDLGPEFTLKGIKAHKKRINQKDNYFNTYFTSSVQFKLPDDSLATLYFPQLPPILYKIEDIENLSTEIRNALKKEIGLSGENGIKVNVALNENNALDLFIDFHLFALMGIGIENMSLQFNSVILNLNKLNNESVLEFIQIENASINISLNKKDLVHFFKEELKTDKPVLVSYQDDVLGIMTEISRIPLDIGLKLLLESEYMVVDLKHIYIGKVFKIPVLPLRGLVYRRIDFPGGTGLPVNVYPDIKIID